MNNKTMEERFDEKFNFADTFEDSRRLCDSIQNDVKYFIEQEIELAKKEERDRILKSVNDKQKQERILANLIVRIVGKNNILEVDDISLLEDLVVFETRDLGRCSTLYKVIDNIYK